MTKFRIAVSGAGGGVGQSIIKSLQNTDYEVVALDGEPLAAGLYASKKSYIIPYSNQPDYIEKVIEICKAEGCTIMFPGLDAELPVLTKNRDKFKAAGITVVVSSEEVVEIGNNKMVTFTELMKHGVNVPVTIDLNTTDVNEIDLEYPYVLKEREGGARSQNLYIVKSEVELQNLINRGTDLTQYIAQEYIEGDEYTCGSISLGGECKGVIVMRRILRDGDTYKAFSVRDEFIESEVRKAVEAIKPFGGCNVQLRVKGGKVYVFEINARCSGTTASRTLCGFNEPKMIADYITQDIEPSYTIQELSILRYWKELVVPNELIESMKSNKSLSIENPTQL
ncbi:MAG: ATP-grasp domain-containing protein [Candidatus Microsaccharimonas sp.]